MLTGTLIIIGIFIGFYFLVVRPLQKRYGVNKGSTFEPHGGTGLSDDYLAGRRYTD